MNNAPDNLSDKIKILRGEHAGKEAHVMQYDWTANSLKARLKKEDSKTTVLLRFEDAIFIENKS